jgi:hypothetical protein
MMLQKVNYNNQYLKLFYINLINKNRREILNQ